MTAFHYSVDDNVLQQMVHAIVEVAQPVKILLFGSRARGDSRPDSDLDLMVIMDEGFEKKQKPLQLLNRLYLATYSFGIPEDILIYDVSKVNRLKDSLNHVIGKATREGRVLYERS